MSSILTNSSSMVALATLRNINMNLETVQNEISTGKKVSSAKDNASIWAISTVMSTDVESFKQITDSLNKGSATVGVARAASEQITGLLQDMKELIVSAQEDLNADDRAKIQTDIDALRTSINNIVNAAQLNGQNLLKGTDAVNVLASLDRASDGTVSATNITVSRNDLTTTAGSAEGAKVSGDAGFLSTAQSGNITDGNDADITVAAGTVSTGDTFTINVNSTDYTYTALEGDTINDVANGLEALITAASIANLTVTVSEGADPTSDDATINLAAAGGDVTFDDTGLGATNVAVTAGGLGALSSLSVSTATDATTALNTIEDLLSTAIDAATSFGSAQKQIEGQSEFVQTLIDAMTTGIGTMVDADIEAASAKLQALQVQQQLGIQALSIANGQPQVLLALFR